MAKISKKREQKPLIATRNPYATMLALGGYSHRAELNGKRKEATRRRPKHVGRMRHELTDHC